ncbi:hypothetical protein [Dyadobacter fanqingshengii]|uniref:SGNH/GDSL hydrolase family protein n=1 Tax=Dyadobacter fanqingshengii TaxID=2906443 RepID=A0A9X1TCP4_9BACT|nr:hypothetical protein [Dyadobacter fanqingshengii]MCF0043354.1 hypothetical protein [Dyadobacter fanqingshengii]USJ35826.1 hypothetical protein NFI81_24440 [Dyadobacter fanqingshengii]
MAWRSFLFSVILFVLLIVVTEIVLRIALCFYGYPFLKPGNYMCSGFYPTIKEMMGKDIRNDDAVQDVLILGGSVISTPWSNMEVRLDTILRKKYGNKKKFAFYNTAAAGHTSLDNLIKYKLLEDKRFDLVIYYEAINENRANCIPDVDFRSDYTHIKWYCDIYLLQSHPEINFTVIPYVCDLVMKGIEDKMSKKIYARQEQVDPGFAKFGANIKTGSSYRKNLKNIIDLSRKRGDELLLLSYASFFPKGVKLTGEQKDMDYFAGCHYASPVTIWGEAEYVKKGIYIHNQILRELAIKSKTHFFDMAENMPQDGRFFCDVCHVSEPGAQNFSKKLATYIVDSKLVE